MYQEIYNQYKNDADFRNECLKTAVIAGSRIGKKGAIERLYRFEKAGLIFQIRHNADGTFTAM